MKIQLSTFLFLGASLAIAQGNEYVLGTTAYCSDTANGLPRCAVPCVNSAISSTGCKPFDVQFIPRTTLRL
jgi:hypothetical protein